MATGVIIVGAMIGAGVGGVLSAQKTGSPWGGALTGALLGAAGGAVASGFGGVGAGISAGEASMADIGAAGAMTGTTDAITGGVGSALGSTAASTVPSILAEDAIGYGYAGVPGTVETLAPSTTLGANEAAAAAAAAGHEGDFLGSFAAQDILKGASLVNSGLNLYGTLTQDVPEYETASIAPATYDEPQLAETETARSLTPEQIDAINALKAKYRTDEESYDLQAVQSLYDTMNDYYKQEGNALMRLGGVSGYSGKRPFV